MASKSTPKRLTFKVATFSDQSQQHDLQHLLKLALKKTKPLTRQEKTKDNSYRLINSHTEHNKMRCGEFLNYETGHRQMMAKMDGNADELPLSSLPPAQESEFLNSVFYFTIRNNAVIFSQSQTLKSSQFESYLNWLFVECDLLGMNEYVSLNDLPKSDSLLKISEATKIQLFTETSFTPDEDETTYSAESGYIKTFLSAINSTLGNSLNNVSAKNILANKDLGLKLEVSWNHQAPNSSTGLLDILSNQLRHIDDDDLRYNIKTKSGDIQDDEIKLWSMKHAIKNDHGIIDKVDFYIKMEHWFEELISSGRVEPDAVQMLWEN